ncbi:uncharacterized protein P884DRAFT_265763 [Thermothelomyces heterothallicus CBS 202.75]|uniref:uncharacterized protein n=1 Tax=Thermothelomyces heterothallicus CBS 202.75 TaxID=1149848 RepID=UPI00374265A0
MCPKFRALRFSLPSFLGLTTRQCSPRNGTLGFLVDGVNSFFWIVQVLPGLRNVACPLVSSALRASDSGKSNHTRDTRDYKQPARRAILLASHTGAGKLARRLNCGLPYAHALMYQECAMPDLGMHINKHTEVA